MKIKKHIVWYAKDVDAGPSPENTAEYSTNSFWGLALECLRNSTLRKAIAADRVRFIQIKD